jgi:hypothetical protein
MNRAAWTALATLSVVLCMACAAPSTSPAVTAPPSPKTLTRDEAVAICRRLADNFGAADVLRSRFGTFRELTVADVSISADAPPDAQQPVWLIMLGMDYGPAAAQGETFIVDAVDGHVIQHYHWIT